tara:strand:+ start:1166 stop:2161 length:996 start_codon:yes stop_codon:yes gene_type:complete
MSIPSSPSYDSTGSYDGIGKFKNNANGELASAVAAGDTTINLNAGHGNRFPTVNASENEYFFATLIDTSGNLEVVKVTARVNDSLTVVRGQDGTSAIAFAASDLIELRPTAGGLDRFLQVTGPQTGHNKKFVNSEFAGGTVNATTLQVGGVDAVSVSGTQTLTNKTLTDPVINGTMTGTANFIQTGMIVMWHGLIANIPTGWALCDGNNGTPNLTDKFIVGAAADSGGAAKTFVEGTYEQTGGSNDAVVVTHTHTGTTSQHPGHRHNYTIFDRRLPQSGSSTNCWEGTNTAQTSLAGQHTHSFTTNAPSGASDGVNKNIPEYFALAFIMKT